MPFTPITSLKRELAVMFAFIGLSIATMAAYWIFWRFAQKRNAAKELARREDFAVRERAAANMSEMKKSHKRENSNSSETPKRTNRNGNSEGGLGFGDVQEDLVV
ncbi:hypothetical protein FQN49_002959 [Arthroderma sp. PD_2]|nr:hypothetical protein FQN49_002959 [Arthroderma sp. PD_2]